MKTWPQIRDNKLYLVGPVGSICWFSILHLLLISLGFWGSGIDFGIHVQNTTPHFKFKRQLQKMLQVLGPRKWDSFAMYLADENHLCPLWPRCHGLLQSHFSMLLEHSVSAYLDDIQLVRPDEMDKLLRSVLPIKSRLILAPCGQGSL